VTQAEAKAREIIDALAAKPIARWLNYSADWKDGALLHHLGFAEEHIGNPGIRALHGGVIATFLEFSAQVEIAVSLGKPILFKAVSISTDYMTSSKAADMTARVTIARAARRIAFLDATGWQDDAGKPVASARVCLRTGALAQS